MHGLFLEIVGKVVKDLMTVFSVLTRQLEKSLDWVKSSFLGD